MEVIARAVVMRGDSVLLCRRLDRGYVYLPGGHVETGESAAQALVREFKEETGLDCAVGAPLAIAECRFTQDRVIRSEVNLVFHVELSSGGRPEPVVSMEPGLAFEWAPQRELQSLDMRPSILRDWLVGYRPGRPVAWLTSDETATRAGGHSGPGSPASD